jgi:hypothetical protein
MIPLLVLANLAMLLAKDMPSTWFRSASSSWIIRSLLERTTPGIFSSITSIAFFHCSKKILYPVVLVGSRTRDRAKAGPGLVKKIADLTIFNHSKGKSGSYDHVTRVGIEDLTIFNQSKGKSGSYDHAARVGMQNHSKGKSLLHLTSLK